MQCGDIYAWDSNQAANHSRKYKFHLCISLSAGKFLFINTTGEDAGALWITKSEWPEMPKDKSFISCNTLLTYKQADIKDPKPKGRLTDTALMQLMDHVDKSEIMAEEDIDFICDTLQSYLDNK